MLSDAGDPSAICGYPAVPCSQTPEMYGKIFRSAAVGGPQHARRPRYMYFLLGLEQLSANLETLVSAG